MIRDYEKGVHETLDITIVNAGSSKNALKADSIFSNAFYDFTLYSDSAYTIPISSSAYESTSEDAYYTSSEVGYTDEAIYSEYRVLDPTYQTGTIYARCESLGVYTNGAAVGQDQTPISTTQDYTSLNSAYLDILIVSGLSANITISVIDGGGDERNQFKVINNDPTYSVTVVDDAGASDANSNVWSWEVLPLSKELFYMDSFLHHGAGLGIVYNNPSNTVAVSEASILGAVNTGEKFEFDSRVNSGLFQYFFSTVRIGNKTIDCLSPTLTAGSDIQTLWDYSILSFDSTAIAIDIKTIRKLYY